MVVNVNIATIPTHSATSRQAESHDLIPSIFAKDKDFAHFAHKGHRGEAD